MTVLKAVPLLLWLAALTLLGWILSQLPLATITQTISTLSPAQWFAWFGLNLAIILLATQRWWVITQLLKLPVRFGELLMMRQAGQAVSFITPGPQFGGEPLQIFWLWKRSKLPIHSALLALGLDRFYELWINFSVLIFSVALLLATLASQDVVWQNVLVGLVLILLSLTLGGWLILKQPKRVLFWLKKVTVYWHHHPRLQHLEAHWQHLGSDLQRAIKEQKPALFLAFILSLLGWGGLIAELWLLLSFFDLALDFSDFMVILVAMRLAFLLPLPGGLGTLESSLFWAFQYLSLPTSAVLGLIALMRLRDVLVLLVGLWCLRVMHWRQ